ncbi:MAG TPA: glycoside hydrolase family 127 protein [Cyclobacteriaceae bacterium]|nr:glycoside hydrolase family 127 protein [Cyclobacteriaceae bacterium]
MRYLSKTVVAILLAAGPAWSQNYVPEENNPKIKVKPVVEIKAFSFHPGEVELLDSEFLAAMKADAGYLLKIEPDRLLSQFRSHSGLQPKAERYGGWESEGLAGHSLGHHLSACALHYAATHNDEYLKRVNYIVDQLEECQRARKTGYIGAIPKEDSVFREVSKGNIRSRGFDLNGAWSPWYTVHKVMAGLLDAYLYCDNNKALTIEKSMADWADTLLKDLNDEQIQKMLLCEYGGMNEVLVNTYTFTGDKKYLDLSYKFHDKKILDSLAMGIDVVVGKHSNTQVPKAIGTARRFEVTGRQSDFAISDFFWKTIVDHHTYAPGGNSNYEYLGKEDSFNEKLTDNTMETCNTYNMLKLTRHLFAMNPSAAYMDFYERALYNHILASQNRSTGMMCYFVPLRMGTKKEFSDEFNTFTCCVGSGMENHVKYNESIYSKGVDGSLYVNLFIPSKVTWKEKGVTVTMNSQLPQDPKVILTINTKKSVMMPIRVRVPSWATGPIFKSDKIENGYLVIDRKWKNGDKIELTLQSNIYSVAMPDNPSRQAFFNGPVLLAGNLGPAEPDPMKGIPPLVTNSKDPGEIMRAGNIRFQPFYSIADDHYSVYWDVFTQQEWAEKQLVYESRRKLEYEREQSTTDMVRLGEMQPERDHELAGENTEVGESHTHKYRTANDGGYFSFTMKVVPDFSYTLIATYWGMDNRGRQFDVLIDGEKIASEDLNKYKESRFYDINYRIPTSLTNGKTKVTVRFQPKAKNSAGPVYGVRMVKEAQADK